MSYGPVEPSNFEWLYEYENFHPVRWGMAKYTLYLDNHISPVK